MANDLLIEDATGMPRMSKDVELAEEVIRLKNAKDHWAVIDKLLEAWSRRAPDEVDALQIELEDHRENLTDKRFGTTSGGKNYDRRFKLVFPRQLMVMIRTIYRSEELPMDDKFMQEFAKRYPFFRVAEKD
jgi:hypothetical protein